ncbi:hypothetical protein GIB67_033624 [Kingdonia uniflora]|uniref:Wall-associated receptor kinase C-terminal domain-containing protein n=1 Tax=Kingdonia uniflora TaxID=39325 RepID=A0A7J7LAS0_9MAGN|nr:hypothetical protein GIB67_033624 [Kingdonia uniflora]
MNPNLPIILLVINERVSAHGHSTCRSFCGNLTVDYPFTVHLGFRDLLFCVNDVLMFPICSGSYRVLEIDYAYQALTLHDPDMSTCNKIVRGRKGNEFVIDLWRGLQPCRNVSGMGCKEYYGCPAWDSGWTSMSEVFRANPPECCSVTYEAIRAMNLSRLECGGYSSAYSLAPLHLRSPKDWSYGIRVRYSEPGDCAFCRSCEATGGTCGYDDVGARNLCLCNG